MSEAKWLTGRLRILGSAKSAQSIRLAKSKAYRFKLRLRGRFEHFAKISPDHRLDSIF